MLKSVRLSGLLSFAPGNESIELGRVNAFIGANASGKSNFLEAIELLSSTPNDLIDPIRKGGGVSDWIWKGPPEAGSPGSRTDTATIDVVFEPPPPPRGNQKPPIRYALTFAADGRNRFEIVEERIENDAPYPGHKEPYFYYRFRKGQASINVSDSQGPRSINREDIDPTASILKQRRDPDLYPELAYLYNRMNRIAFYREWSFGRYAPARLPQKIDAANDRLLPDGSNLALYLSRLEESDETRNRLTTALSSLYGGFKDFRIRLSDGTAQLSFVEVGRTSTIPATRLSDGTLRFVCLAAVLSDPHPPPLLCIEEPELGLHPDAVRALADLIRDASERTQILFTTHSDVLVDSFNDQPECIVVASKEGDDGTRLCRLDELELAPWLEKYRLGELWSRGHLGGNRW